ncbi:YfiR family protein [Geobacter sp. OR-1]|uniref:YfiR family protein n=1 Tax=Geobacter sp. OR-1 TaxID=1266765 RepID=UPI001ED9B916|nr:YfiR family protein [Geobacter sp. OR-1]
MLTVLRLFYRRYRFSGLLTRAAALLVCLAAATITLHPAWAGDLEIKVKAAYIYNFTKFVDWSDDGGREPFRICVVGTDPIRTVLGELSNREVKGRPIRIQRVKDLNALPQCHLMFISRSEEQQLPFILQRLQGTQTLTVSDISQFSQKGGMVSFITEKDRVKIEISQRAVRQAGLKVSAKLFEIARVVP